MSYWHGRADLPAPLSAAYEDHRVKVRLPEGQEATFWLLAVGALTTRSAETIANEARHGPVLVRYERASSQARGALRDAGVSFAGADGRVFIRAPGILVDRDDPHRPERSADAGLPENLLRNPFSLRAARIPRLLLLEHHHEFSVTELADIADLDHATASRALRALREGALLTEPPGRSDRRRRAYRLQRPRALLDAWLPLWRRRRVRSERWEVGARTAHDAVGMLVRAASAMPTTSWAVGGLAGAAPVHHVEEPVDVRLWATAPGLDALRRHLHPEPARGGTGTLRVCEAPDPWTLSLARNLNGLPTVDPVQLWLDCSSEGGRALEAAEAIVDLAGWS